MSTKLSLEDAFDKFLADNPRPTPEECTKLILKYAPKRFKDWSGLLRSIADWVDAHPQLEFLTPQQVRALITLSPIESE